MTDTIQIPLSKVGSPEGFLNELGAYCKALEEHRIGEPGKPPPDLPPGLELIGHGVVDQIIQRIPGSGPVESRGPDRFHLALHLIDYVNDLPSLADRKQALLIELHAAARAAAGKIMSPARAGLLAMESSDAAAKPVKSRSAADKATIKKAAAFGAAVAKISRVVTRAAVAIDDLTDETINEWTAPKFD